MTTATEANTLAHQNADEARANMLLERRIEDFAKDFMPANSMQALRFHSGLTSIVRQATIDANRVYAAQLTKHTTTLMAAAQPPRMVFPVGIVDPDHLKPGSVVFTPPQTPYPPRPGMLPNKPGFYWAKLVRPAGVPDNETAADWIDDTYEPVDVFDNGGEGDEALMVFVIGRNAAQRLDAFEWGNFIGDHQ